ncbi:SDR family NAD(P)-dependent oxidoreductase [Exiguobacterium sp.]|uniref:SDR family NAD(P)-dependent oxidoreductase n=1 Tax=Exiguobacterium sp. TaxID=44751 RepID=UPI00307EAD36
MILITGASSGIEQAFAYLLADTTAHLILVARREAEMNVMKSEIEKGSATVSVFPADHRIEEERNGLLAYLHQLSDELDVVVSNAGISINRPIIESLDRYHDFTRTIAINYFAQVQLVLSFIPLNTRPFVPYLSDGRHGAQEKSQIQGFGQSAYDLIEIKREKCKLIRVSYTRYSQHMISYRHIHKLE